MIEASSMEQATRRLGYSEDINSQPDDAHALMHADTADDSTLAKKDDEKAPRRIPDLTQKDQDILDAKIWADTLGNGMTPEEVLQMADLIPTGEHPDPDALISPNPLSEAGRPLFSGVHLSTPEPSVSSQSRPAQIPQPHPSFSEKLRPTLTQKEVRTDPTNGVGTSDAVPRNSYVSALRPPRWRTVHATYITGSAPNASVATSSPCQPHVPFEHTARRVDVRDLVGRSYPYSDPHGQGSIDAPCLASLLHPSLAEAANSQSSRPVPPKTFQELAQWARDVDPDFTASKLLLDIARGAYMVYGLCLRPV